VLLIGVVLIVLLLGGLLGTMLLYRRLMPRATGGLQAYGR